MGMGNLDSGKDRDDKPRRAGMRMTAMAAGVLAAGAANAQNADAQLPYDSYDVAGYTDSYELMASPEALETIDTLNEKFGQKLSVTPEKYELISGTINAYITTHPAIEGKTTTTKEGASSEPSYDPLLDLHSAVIQRTNEMNPLLLGLLMQNLDQRMKLTPAEKSK